MKHIFLSGAISGKINNNEGQFSDIAKVLRAAGHVVIVPHELMMMVDCTNFTHDDYCRRCVQFMLDCDVVCQLQGWQNSKGASIERAVADLFKIPCQTVEEILA